MPGRIETTLADELRRDARRLDRACQAHFGISSTMFRSVKFLFYITTLVFSGWLVEMQSVDPFTAMIFAAFLISGPEGLEAYLIRQGVIDEPPEPPGGSDD